MSQRYQDVTILLVDDDGVDTRAVRRMLQKQQISNPVITACDGVEGLQILRGEGGRARLPRPFLILLDINMPRMNGLQFLVELRKDAALTDSIVFILTTSAADADQAFAYKQHIAGYLLKSEAGENFVKVVQMLDKFVSAVQFPLDHP